MLLKPTILTAIATLSLGCTAVGPAMQTAGTPALQAQPVLPQGLPVSDGWQPNERLLPAPQAQYDWKAKTGPFRRGTTPKGRIYQVHADGSGWIRTSENVIAGSWNFTCKNDAMTDRRDCWLTDAGDELVLQYLGSAKPTSVCLAAHDFPGRTGAVRINGRKPAETTNRHGCLEGAFGGRLSAGRIAVTRSFKWPYDYGRDATVELEVLGEAMSLVSYLYTALNRLSFDDKAVNSAKGSG